MKEGTLDRPTFEAIEAYVLGRMTDPERAAFEHRMASDPDLLAEVGIERENIQAVELGGISRILKSIAAEGSVHEPKTRSWSGLLKYAAMVAALTSAIIWWVSRSSVNEQLFTAHFKCDPGLPVVMGATDDPIFADAMVAYKLGDYAEARAKWAPLLAAEPTNDTLLYYIANAWLAEDHSEQAIPELETLVQAPGSAFHTRARWYLFLAYVRSGEANKAQALGLTEDPVYGARVRSILQDLSR